METIFLLEYRGILRMLQLSIDCPQVAKAESTHCLSQAAAFHGTFAGYDATILHLRRGRISYWQQQVPPKTATLQATKV